MKSVIIEKLIEIEDSASIITKDTEEKEKSLPAMIQSACKEIEETLKAKHEKRTKEIYNKNQEETSTELEDIAHELKVKTKNIEVLFEENHVAWENELFEKIVRG